MKRIFPALFPVLVLFAVTGCSDRSTSGTGAIVTDVSALAGAYSQLTDALNGRDTAALWALIDSGYYDRGATCDSVRAGVTAYFNEYDSIDACFPLDSLHAEMYGSMARVTHTLDIVSRKTTSGDTLAEFTSGTMDWRMTGGIWRVYGNQLDSIGLDNPGLPDTGTTGILPLLATHYTAALSVPARIISELAWYRAGSGTSYTDVAFLPAVDTVDTDSLVVGAGVLGRSAGQGITITNTACYGTLYDSSTAVVGTLVFSGTLTGLSVNGIGYVSGMGDTYAASVTATVAGSVTVSFNGTVFAGHSAGGHAQDSVRLVNNGAEKNSLIIRSIPYSVRIFTDADSAVAAGYGTYGATGDIGLCYPHGASVPRTGLLFTDFKTGAEFEPASYADTVDSWFRRWVDPVTGMLNDAEVSAYFAGTGSHRGGKDGISGYLTDLPATLPSIDMVFRDADEFYAGVVYRAGSAVVQLHPVAGGAGVAQDTVAF